ncbi:TonB-dependent receptor, partial [Pseudoxanthomonas sp. SGD-10]
MVKKRKTTGSFVFCCCKFTIAFVLAAPAMAKAQADSVTTQHLNEVTVKAFGHSAVLDSATPVQLLDAKELGRLNSLSVADALRFFSGVQLKDYGGVGGLKTINVRSMGANHTSVFYNGVQLANAQNGQVDLGKFSLENLEEISLFSGQNPSLLQTAKAYSSASSLYLKTRTPLFDTLQKRQVKLSLKAGSFGLVNPSVNYNRKLNRNSSINISGEVTRAHGRYQYRYTNGVYDTTALRQNTDIDAKRIESTFFTRFADSARLQAQAYYYHSERGLPGAIVSNKFNFSQRQLDRNFFLQATYQSASHKKLQWLVNAKYSKDYLRYSDPDHKYGNRDGYLINRYHQQEYYASVANKY